MPRHTPSADRIAEARLDGAARRLLREKVPRERAIADLRAITTRVDLLTHAAGTSLGAWQHSPVTSWQGRDVALLLVDAGADVDQVKAIAAETAEHLGRSTGRKGIGEGG